MNIVRKNIVRKLFLVVGVLILIPVVALLTLAVSARSSDGPSVVLGGSWGASARSRRVPNLDKGL